MSVYVIKLSNITGKTEKIAWKHVVQYKEMTSTVSSYFFLILKVINLSKN